MPTKVRVNSLAIREFRKAKGLSRQAVSDAAKNNNLNISRPTIERLESAQRTDSFLYEKVKILADTLEVSITKIIQIEANTYDNVAAKQILEGRDLQNILKSCDKLVYDMRVEPTDINIQNFLLKILDDWEKESQLSISNIKQLDKIKDAFNKRSSIDELKSHGIYIHHGESHEIAYFDVHGGWEYNDDEESVWHGEETPHFYSVDADIDKIDDHPGFDGIGAQPVDILVFSNSEQTPKLIHNVNPNKFDQTYVDEYSSKYIKFKSENKKEI